MIAREGVQVPLEDPLRLDVIVRRERRECPWHWEIGEGIHR